MLKDGQGMGGDRETISQDDSMYMNKRNLLLRKVFGGTSSMCDEQDWNVPAFNEVYNIKSSSVIT